MKNNDLVSIIIPCYNQAQYLEESVQSALDQTYPNIEIIIVNDGSPDNTEKVALNLQKKYPKKIQVISQKNSGVSEARNNAIEQSKGQYILPLDADDKMDKEMIDQCVDVLIACQVDIVYTDIQCFGIQENVFIQNGFVDSNILYANVPAPTSLYRREVWEENSGYKANMKEGNEDWEFWVNAFENNFKFHYLPKALFLYRTKDESRDVSARKLDEYLSSKIVLNHSNLYMTQKVEKSISIIKQKEKLADFYFYSSKEILENDEQLVLTIGAFINDNILQEKQTIDVPNYGKIGLCSLEILENDEDIGKLYKEMYTEIILFYAPLRYETSSVYCTNFAWDTHKGTIKAKGTVFPYTMQSKTERIRFQSLAYEYLENFNTYILEKKETLLFELKEKNHMLEERMKLRDKTISELKKIVTSVKHLSGISILSNPLKKYTAYKNLLDTYQKIGNNK